jgi:hypothetical protein
MYIRFSINIISAVWSYSTFLNSAYFTCILIFLWGCRLLPQCSWVPRCSGLLRNERWLALFIVVSGKPTSHQWSAVQEKADLLYCLKMRPKGCLETSLKIPTNQCCVKTPEVWISQNTRYYFVCIAEVSLFLCMQTTFKTRHTAPQMLYTRITRFSKYLH